MNPYEYIISELTNFILEFPRTRVRYEHDNSSETHFIEVVPNDVYHLDTDYIKWESEMFDRFIELFPEQNICFISDDALVGLDKIDFELCGIQFATVYTTNIHEVSIENNQIQVNSIVIKGVSLNITTCIDSVQASFGNIYNYYSQSNLVGEIPQSVEYPLAA